MHSYFSPYGSPYDASVTFFSVLCDLHQRLNQKTHLADSPFRFATGIDEYTGFVAWTLAGMQEILGTLPLASLEYHNREGDYASWARTSLGDELLAEKIGQAAIAKGREAAKEPFKGNRCCTFGENDDDRRLRLFGRRAMKQGTGREWLVTNGLGGYASATAIGCNTRAYHGLLVAALNPPGDRRLLLSSLDEEVNGLSLANHKYPGVIHPQGFRYLQEFWVDPIPRFCYQVGEIRVEKAISMIHGENTTIISYKIHNGQGTMKVFPLVHSRNFHAASELPAIGQEPRTNGTILQSSTRLTLFSDRARYVPEETTYYNFEYEEELRRGLAYRENLFSPGYFSLELSGDTNFAIAASTWRTSMVDCSAERKKEEERLQGLMAPVPELAKAADAFLVKRGNSLSLIAGYHWFDDWGRDAMIALPGLLLTTGRFQ